MNPEENNMDDNLNETESNNSDDQAQHRAEEETESSSGIQGAGTG